MAARFFSCFVFAIVAAGVALPAQGELPTVNYMFPAGGQRGTTVNVRVGGHYLHEKANFAIMGEGVKGPSEITPTETIWFEGPVIHQPLSQRAEDYPKDYAARIEIAADAPLGARPWRVWTSQGVTPARRFVVGDLPETIEQEVDGEAIPTAVSLPVTINGRIFPREDVDIWTFQAAEGKPVLCRVAAQAFGSPLDARLELRDPRGAIVQESVAANKKDPVLRFVPSATGTYELRIHDVRFEGLQNYVYRLTIVDGADATASEDTAAKTNSVASSGDVNTRAESEPNNEASAAPLVEDPIVVTGVIDPPGDVDVWAFEAKKGKVTAFQIDPAATNSPLQSLVIIRDTDGKEVARRSALDNVYSEMRLNFNPPANGTYYTEVRDRFAARGGKAFTYAMRIGPQKAGVRLELPSDVVSVDRGRTQKLPINITREAGFAGTVKVSIEGLPEGVKAAEVSVDKNKVKADLVLQAEADARVSLHHVRVVGKFEVDGETKTELATFPNAIDEAMNQDLLLAVTVGTPFKYQAEFALSFAPVGSVYRKRYIIDRGGYEGPLEARLADRQGRHLQGVTGPTITIPADADDFVYPITLAPWMELGRTSRVVPMLSGIVTDEQGVKHKVCYMTNDQNCQLVNIVSPSPLRLVLDRPSIVVQPNGQATLNVQIRHSKEITSPVTLELVVPSHVRDVRAETKIVPNGLTQKSAAPPSTASPNTTSPTTKSNSSTGIVDVPFVIQFGANAGPFNMPLTIKATCQLDGDPLTAEATFDCVRIP